MPDSTPDAMAPPAGGDDTYWELDVVVPHGSEELWSHFCFEQGALGSETLAETPEALHLRFYFDALDPAAVAGWPERFRHQFAGVAPPGAPVARQLARADWAQAWHEHFRPLPLDRAFLVCPPWEVPPPEDRQGRLPLLIEPGQGFGTGQHETTALALAQLEARLATDTPARVLDLGTGSGILAIAAGLRGVPRVVAVDMDGRVLPEVRHNFRLNGLPAPVLVRGRPDALRGTHPVVVANIITEVLLMHQQELAALTAPGGSLVLSGILTRERERVLAAFEALGFELAAAGQQAEWWACTLRRMQG